MSHEGFAEIVRLEARGKEAKNQGFVLEAVAIRAYLTEFWLRILIVKHTGIQWGRGITFGALVDRAADCHFDSRLVERCRRFNEHRNNAIHRLLEGRTTYDQLWDAFAKDETLPNDVADEVIRLAAIGDI
jgi:hypothetical protein